jgi:hypothetical protein
MENDTIDFYEPDAAMDSVTVGELDRLGKEIAEQSAKVGCMEEHLKGEKGKLEKMKAQMIAYLSHFGKKSYPIPGAGTFTRVEKLSFQVPKEEEAKKEFLKWLRSKGDGFYISTVTVNHNTLNAIANEAFEQAAAEGRSFSIPGLGDPKKYEMLSIRKGK